MLPRHSGINIPNSTAVTATVHSVTDRNNSETGGTPVKTGSSSANGMPYHAGLPLLTPWNRFVKRSIDVAISLPIVLFILPLLCVFVKTLQWRQSAGPLLYRQTRSGRNRRQFVIVKFRTLHLPSPGTSDIDENPDKRTFPLGQLLRDTKIDETPQFVNVLLGSMSIVGPRPHHAEDCRKFESVVNDYRRRSIALPGITGLAQYDEYRGDFEENCLQARVDRDLNYINDWSHRLDAGLIAKTAVAVLLRLGSLLVGSVSSTFRTSENRQPVLRILPESAAVQELSIVGADPHQSADHDSLAA